MDIYKQMDDKKISKSVYPFLFILAVLIPKTACPINIGATNTSFLQFSTIQTPKHVMLYQLL